MSKNTAGNEVLQLLCVFFLKFNSFSITDKNKPQKEYKNTYILSDT